MNFKSEFAVFDFIYDDEGKEKSCSGVGVITFAQTGKKVAMIYSVDTTEHPNAKIEFSIGTPDTQKAGSWSHVYQEDFNWQHPLEPVMFRALASWHDDIQRRNQEIVDALNAAEGKKTERPEYQH